MMHTLLIVDDEKLILEGMRRAIESLGLFRVLCAPSGARAMEIIEKEPVEAMLLDISMPDMNGIELMRALSDTQRKPLTVIISGFEKFDYAKQALSYGALDYVLKPVDADDVREIGKRLYGELSERDRRAEELLNLRRRAGVAQASGAVPLGEKNLRAAQAAKKLIGESYFDGELSVNAIAERLGYSPNYLGNVFKRAFGQSLNECLNRVRIDAAQKLMDETEMLVYEIAFRVGYNDQHYFSKTFKKYLGVSPSEYREKNR